MSALACAGIIANLEGSHRTPLVFLGEGEKQLSQLDARTKALERLEYMTLQPPMLETTWESLAYRVYRLHRRSNMMGTNALRRGESEIAFKELAPEASVTLDQLHNMIHAIPYRMEEHKPKWRELPKDEANALSYLVQRLCHSAGDQRIKLGKIPTNQAELYALAVDISIENENNPVYRPISPYPMPPPPPPPAAYVTPRPRARPYRIRPNKARSARSCSSDSDLDTESLPSYRRVKRGSRAKSFFRFGWMKKLFCLGGKKKDFNDDDLYD